MLSKATRGCSRHRPPPARVSRRQLDMEGRTAARRALDPDPAAVIRHDRLHDGEAKAGAMLLGRVIRCEQAVALLFGKALTGISDLDPHRAVRTPRADGELATGRHRVDRI